MQKVLKPGKGSIMECYFRKERNELNEEYSSLYKYGLAYSPQQICTFKLSISK